MAIYVFCCNARVSFHSVYSKGLVQETLFVNCPSVICLPSMLYLYGETPLVNYGPRSYFPYCLINNHQSSIYFSAIYFSATILHALDTFNPLCSAKPVSLTTSLNSWGKVICCLCVGFHVALTPWKRPATVSLQHLQKQRLSPTGRLNLGFITKGKQAVVLIIPSLLGFPTVQPTSTRHQQDCLAPSHTS